MDLLFAHSGQASVVGHSQLDSELALGAVLVFRITLRAFGAIAELPAPCRDLAVVGRFVDEFHLACHSRGRWRVVKRRHRRVVDDGERLADDLRSLARGVGRDDPNSECIAAQAHTGRVPHVRAGVGKALRDLVPLSPIAGPVEVYCESVRRIVRVRGRPFDLLFSDPRLAARRGRYVGSRRSVDLERHWDGRKRTVRVISRHVQVKRVRAVCGARGAQRELDILASSGHKIP